ncbi:MAG: lipase family protein [Candidatus Nanopelagicales bacterium]
MRVLKGVGIIVGAAIIAVVVILTATIVGGKVQTDHDQSEIAAFYETPNPLPAGKPGDIIRQEKFETPNVPDNAEMYRVLYRTEDQNGKPRVSGAFIVIPKAEAPAGGRKVLAWAHGTTGMGDACAPSRTKDPINIIPWVNEAIDRGYVVTATDYAGLGTEGPQMYLIGQDEARDVVNSVRMARNFPGSHANKTYGVFGHSQGGHSSLWTGHVGPEYAPELDLVGVAAAAPAGELIPLVDGQWNQMAAWVIGPEVLISFKERYPDLPTDGIVTDAGMKGYESMAETCINDAAIEAMIDEKLGRKFFASNPMDNPVWRKVAEEQSTKPLPKKMPAMMLQSVNDGVVLPSSNSILQTTWCKAGSELQSDWLGPLAGNTAPVTLSPMTHMKTGIASGPLALSWMYQRFENAPAVNNCNTPPALVHNPPAA